MKSISFNLKQASLSSTSALFSSNAFKMADGELRRLGQALRAARMAKGKRLKDVGEHLGVTPQAVGQWERGENGPTTDKLLALGRFLEADFIGGGGLASARKVIRPSGPESSEVEKAGEDWPDLGDEWMDVRGVVVGGDDSYFYFGDVIDQVRRPPGIRNAKNVAALNVAGSSMVPRFEPGELIYVQQRLAAPGDYVVIELYPETESDAPKSFLKRLVKRTGRRLYCSQLNPPADIEFDMGEVKTIWRVLTLRDLLG